MKLFHEIQNRAWSTINGPDDEDEDEDENTAQGGDSDE